MNSEFQVVGVFEQAATFDGKFSLPIDTYLLMNLINGMSAQDQTDLSDMKDPKRLAVQVTIKTRELEMPNP